MEGWPAGLELELPEPMVPIDWARMWRPEHHPLETVIRAAVAYAFVHIAFRVVGRRELGRHSTYEIVLLLFVSVAMRQTIVGTDESVTTGLLGMATLLVIDALVAWLVRASPRAAVIIDGPVRELIRDGRPDEDALKRARVTRELAAPQAQRASSGAAGSVKWKRVVSPGVLSAHMAPPWASTRPLQM